MLLTHLEARGITEIDTDVDYYWRVPEEQAYDPNRTSIEPDLGQLSHDWARLDKILRGEREPVATALGWLAAVFRAVSERLDR